MYVGLCVGGCRFRFLDMCVGVCFWICVCKCVSGFWGHFSVCVYVFVCASVCTPHTVVAFLYILDNTNNL